MACGDLTLELLNSKRFFDYIWTTWSWRNAVVEILHGGECLPLAEYATIYTGYIKDPTWGADKVKFETVNWLELLSRQVPVNPCFGAGVADDARGKPAPAPVRPGDGDPAALHEHGPRRRDGVDDRRSRLSDAQRGRGRLRRRDPGRPGLLHGRPGRLQVHLRRLYAGRRRDLHREGREDLRHPG